MRFFITGATGFIGYHLVKSLAGKGHEVHALYRSDKKASALPPDVRLIYGDVMDRGLLKKEMAGCDYVFHLAAFAKVWAKDSGTFYQINVGGTNNVLDAARANGIKRVVVVSTAGVFGASFDDTITEGFVRKKDFFNEYEGSKTLSELYIRDYVLEGLDVVIVSPTRVYGNYIYGEPASVSLLIKKYSRGKWRLMPGPPDKTGNYVFVGDVVNGMQLAMDKGRPGRTYILGGENHSYRSFFDTLAEVTGIKKSLIRVPLALSLIFAYFQLFSAKLFGTEPLVAPKWIAKARYDWRVSSDRAVSELGYRITPLDEGIKMTLEGSDWEAPFDKCPENKGK